MRSEWKPKLTPAKLRALRLVVECHDPNGYEARGTILASCHPLEMMGLVRCCGYYHPRVFSTRAGRKALNDPASYKPVDVWTRG